MRTSKTPYLTPSSGALALVVARTGAPFGPGAQSASRGASAGTSVGQGHRAVGRIAPGTPETTSTVSSFGPCAPITSDCSMSAVLDGPATNTP